MNKYEFNRLLVLLPIDYHIITEKRVLKIYIFLNVWNV